MDNGIERKILKPKPIHINRKRINVENILITKNITHDFEMDPAFFGGRGGGAELTRSGYLVAALIDLQYDQELQ